MKKIFLFALVAAFMPVFVSAQENTVLGREGKIMEAGFSTYNLLKNRKTKKEFKSIENTDIAKLNNTLESAKQEQEAKSVKKVKINYKQFLAEEVAKIPEEQKLRWDNMAKKRDYDGLSKEIKSFPKEDSRYDKEKYYILTAVVKVNGKNLVSYGSFQIAQVIISTTKKDSYVYKEAEKVIRAVANSGLAL